MVQTNSHFSIINKSTNTKQTHQLFCDIFTFFTAIKCLFIPMLGNFTHHICKIAHMGGGGGNWGNMEKKMANYPTDNLPK